MRQIDCGLYQEMGILTHEQIVQTVEKAATTFPLTKVSYFGSYADGKATEESDLDLLVEFTTDAISYLTIIALKRILEEELNIRVDVLHAPEFLEEPKKSRLIIRKTMPVYERVMRIV